MHGGKQRYDAHAHLETYRNVRKEQYERDAEADRGAPDIFVVRNVHAAVIGDGRIAHFCERSAFAVTLFRKRGAELFGKGSDLILVHAAAQDEFQPSRGARRRGGIFDVAHVISGNGDLGRAKVFQSRAVIAVGNDGAVVVGDFNGCVICRGRIGIEPEESEQECARNDDRKAYRKAQKKELFQRKFFTHLPFPPF